mmetsp:Transcript_30148/g.73378  ORF Transcript_30148/g.73378 Transcript_30148/m.73378 type:complete len:291 (+) Transcript_30148:85-957(+)|eukprot:CAMPEP_0114523444 /NCGR_PEP_ID=MMETSP0109-20121206/21292_1 /TAXON_ID=29199 /ORGANISM="Chlorarachnion reptans, Strain CCCM449" /LENGTH=290 /DNA_ID=CAMNT_0001704755 /DNA_START=52 /DNA_END=924 /DNA_ORIENTATION=+
MTKNRVQQDQEMLQSTMFAILDSLFWGMIVGTGCLIMSYVLPLTEDSDGREMGTNLDMMANSLFWGATAGSGCLLAIYTLIGALYPPASDINGGSWLDPLPPTTGSRKRGSNRDQKGRDRGGNRRQIGNGKGQEKELQRQNLERGDNDWLIMHMDRILVACCCIMNFPLFSWVLGQDILWWGGLFAVILVTSFLDRSQYLERMPLSPSGQGSNTSNQGSSGKSKRRALKNGSGSNGGNCINQDSGVSPEVADLLQKLSKQYFSLFIFGIIAVWSMGSLVLFRFDSDANGS